MPARPRPLIDLRDMPAALGLLTRLPIKVNTRHAMARGAAAAWAYPLAGLAVAALALLPALSVLALGAPAAVAAGLALACQSLVTGALHEDGLADCADGFWGGWDRKRRLEIMKDSRIGTYGVLALVFGTGLRWAALAAVFERPAEAAAWMAAAAVLSRTAMVRTMTTLPHARPGGLAARVGRPGRATLCAALLPALGAGLMLALLSGPVAAALALATALLAAVGLGRLARARIGGQTGDVLGAVQVTNETALMLLAACLI